MSSPPVTALLAAESLMILPWHDPLVDTIGHDVRSQYVELFWLNVLGPTATWALRRLVTGLDRYPLGYELDPIETAGMLGLAYTTGTSSSFSRALQRCVLFGMAQPLPGGLAVRRRVPPVAERHLARMPEGLRSLHVPWTVRECAIDDLTRGRSLAEVMLAAGDEPEVVERQLLAVGVPPAAATVAVDLVVSGRSPTPDR